MRALAVVMGVAVFVAPADANLETLARARRLYNAGDYDAAVTAAWLARADAQTADAAAVVVARAHLERFRLTRGEADLMAARMVLQLVDRARLGRRDALDHTLGLAETEYLEGEFGAAAELFEPLMSAGTPLDRRTRGRVVDWWAGALDAEARTRPAAERPPYYQRIIDRMEVELTREGGAIEASYWLPAAALGAGDATRAWQAATAGWIRTSFAVDGGAAVRQDLDRLVTEAIVPERVRRESRSAAALVEEWEQAKGDWTKD